MLSRCQASVFPNTVLWALTTGPNRKLGVTTFVCAFVLSIFLPKKTGTVWPVFVCDPFWHIFSLIHLSKSNKCFWSLNHNSCHPVMCLFCFLFELFPNSLWKLMNQWKKNCARNTIVCGSRSNLNPPACLNSVCLSLSPWDGGEGFALRLHLLSTEPWRRRRLTGSKPQLQVLSPGLYQSRLELVSPHS